MATVEELLDHYVRISHCRTLKAERLAERERGGIVLCRTNHDGSTCGAFISPSPYHGGEWRFTLFDADGFSGDYTRSTKAECIRECLVDGYHDTNRNILRELSKLQSFEDGNERTTALARHHAAMHGVALSNAQARHAAQSSPAR